MLFFKKPKILFRKKNFILLEILIALSLVILVALPFVKSPYAILKKQIQNLEAIECDTIAEVSFAEILTSLYEKKFDWEKLIHPNDAIFVLPTKTVQINGFNEKKIHRGYSFSVSKPKKGTKNNIYYKLKIKLTLSSKTNKKVYYHSVIIENGLQSSDDFV